VSKKDKIAEIETGARKDEDMENMKTLFHRQLFVGFRKNLFARLTHQTTKLLLGLIINLSHKKETKDFGARCREEREGLTTRARVEHPFRDEQKTRVGLPCACFWMMGRRGDEKRKRKKNSRRGRNKQSSPPQGPEF
jgi:hypothetical protein